MNYEKIYNDLCRSRKFRGLLVEVGYEIHHIKPRSFGGSDSKCNLVKFTYREHWLAHKLLFKFSKGAKFFKMRHAFQMMSHFNGKVYNTSILYKKYKECVFKYRPYVGCYVINPNVLPEVNGVRSFEEILCRLRYFKVKRFILPTFKSLYRYGEYSTIRNHITHLKNTRQIVVQGWNNFAIYEFTDKYEDLGRRNKRFFPRHISYTDIGFEDNTVIDWKYSEINGFKFRNPMTLRTKPPLEVISNLQLRDSYEESFEYLIKEPLICDTDYCLIEDYKKYHNLRRVRTSDWYEILKTLDFYCSNYNSIGFDKRIFAKIASRQNYRKVYEYLQNKHGVTYKPSVCLVGGQMSKHVLAKVKLPQ